MVTKLEKRLHDELANQREGYEESIGCLQNERDELKRKNDDLAISVEHYGSQMKQWQERYNEAHQEAVQTSRQLHEAKQKVESLNSIVQRFDRDVERAICICRQHLIVSLNLPIKKPDCEVCETSRFIYYLLDILDGE